MFQYQLMLPLFNLFFVFVLEVRTTSNASLPEHLPIAKADSMVSLGSSVYRVCLSFYKNKIFEYVYHFLFLLIKRRAVAKSSESPLMWCCYHWEGTTSGSNSSSTYRNPTSLSITFPVFIHGSLVLSLLASGLLFIVSSVLQMLHINSPIFEYVCYLAIEL